MTRPFDQLVDRLRSFHKKVHGRLTGMLNKEFMGLLDALQVFSNKVNSDVDRTSLKGCLEAVGRIKSFHPYSLLPQHLAAYLEIGWESNEVAHLYGIATNHMYSRIRVMKRKMEDGKIGKKATEEKEPEPFFQLPEYLKDKPPEELTEEDTMVIARIQIAKACMGGSLEASKQVLDRFQRFMQSDLKTKWEQVKILDNFFLSEFLPAVQRHLKINDPAPKILAELEEWGNELMGSETRMANIQRIRDICLRGRIDAKIIFRETLKEVAPEIREIAQKSLESLPGRPVKPARAILDQPEMDSAVRKAKRRGKWQKKEDLGADQAETGDPVGVMEIPAPPALEVESGPEGIPETKTGINW